MSSHFFITVGTSQLSNEMLGLGDIQPVLNKFCNCKTSLPTEEEDVNHAAPILLNRLAQYWNDLETRPDPFLLNTPLGAEISTLIHVIYRQALAENARRKNDFKQLILDHAPEDRFYLHQSDTSSGRLAARVLCEFLTKVWLVPEHSLRIYQADKLNLIPGGAGDARQALINFAYKMTASLKDSLVPKFRDSHRCIIMTGGFKSVIPILDRFSIAYDLPLNYLFEDANAPVFGERLNLDAQTREKIRQVLQVEYELTTMPPIQKY